MSNFVALIVEDDVLQRECLADLLKSEGLEVVECANGEVTELVLASTGPEVRALVTDIELGGEMSGVQLAQYCQAQIPRPDCRDGLGAGPALRSARHPFSSEALSAPTATQRRPKVRLHVAGVWQSDPIGA